MKVLLDENLPHELRVLLMPAHDAYSVRFMGWSSKSNGELLALAAKNGFDVLVTGDRGYEHQINLNQLPCAVVLLLARTNKVEDVQPLVASLFAVLSTLKPKSFARVGYPP